MAKYPNGKIPRDTLIKRGNYHYATAGTWAKWDALVADVERNEGFTLRITEGLNVYRDLEGQEFARKNACAAGRCNDAAVPGTSSHGGVYNGRDSLAIDVANWANLSRDKWYDYCRKHGFEPGFFDWEPWHIIDWEPYRAVSGSQQEDVMDEMIEINGKIYLLTDGAIKHCESPAHVQELQKRTGIPLTKLTAKNKLDEFARALDMHGVPRDAVSANGYVLNPQTGKHENGALWRWDRAVLAKLK